MNTFYKRVKWLSCLVALLLLVACSQEDISNTQGKSTTLKFRIFDVSSEGNNTRSITDGQNMVTTFEQNDQAGLYAVKDGQIILNNIPLTYNANGFWEAKESITASDEMSGVQFYAYYPYRTEAQFDASSTNPFQDMVKTTTPSNNQSSKEGYESADLMVSSACTIGQYNTVSLALRHQKAMICVELPNSSYIFSNDGINPYVLAKSENVQFSLDEKGVLPYFDESSQSYRFIIEPGQEGTLNVTFTNNGQERKVDIQHLAQLQSGKYAKYVIDGGAQLIQATLQVGDYYLADGRIISKDTPIEQLPDNIIGVIFKLGTTEALQAANKNWSHGIVIGLDEIRGKWGTSSTTNSDQNAAGWRYWYRDYGLTDQGSTNAASLVEDNMAEEGYEITQAWRSVPEPLQIGGFTLDYTTELNSNFNTWAEAHPLPSAICSNWYIPSLRDLQNIEAQNSLLSQQLIAAGGKDLLWNRGSTERYWSCNVRSSGSNWCYVGNKTTLGDRYKGVSCKDNAYYRFLFAF